jgi:ABC-type transport system involved in multi-copper enzyme maturation permease subunit
MEGHPPALNVIPVILRELTVASRRRETWNLRLVFGLGIGLAFAFGLLLPHVSPRDRGQTVLWSLALAGFVLCLLSGPYLTADAISAEKREGTLGLLFLTPLNGLQIVLGKMLTHSLQVSFALLGTVPFLFLPVLLGGVTWGETSRLLLVLLLTQLVSLAGGILWSTLTREARTASTGSAASLILLVFAPWFGAFLDSLIPGRWANLESLSYLSPLTLLLLADDSSYLRLLSPGFGMRSGVRLFWSSAGLVFALGLALIIAAGRLLPRVWRRETFLRPAAERSSETHAPGRSLGQTPGPESTRHRRAEPWIWLASRNLDEPGPMRWFGRLALVFFAATLLNSVTTRFWREGFLAAMFTAYALHFVARIQAAWTVTRWLHDERRSGALELLLTTPVSEADLTAAHHESLRRALRRPLRTLLAVNAVLELAVLLFWNHLHMDNHAGASFTTLFVGGALATVADFATLRWLGLQESLRARTPARAAGTAFVRLMIGPWTTLALAILVLGQRGNMASAPVIFSCWFASCLLWDLILVSQARQWLRPGLRDLVREKD